MRMSRLGAVSKAPFVIDDLQQRHSAPGNEDSEHDAEAFFVVATETCVPTYPLPLPQKKSDPAQKAKSDRPSPASCGVTNFASGPTHRTSTEAGGDPELTGQPISPSPTSESYGTPRTTASRRMMQLLSGYT